MNFVCDIGGTKIRTAISWDGREVSDERVFYTPENFDEGMAVLEKIINEYAKKEPITAAAIGIAGVLDTRKYKLVSSPNLPGWVGKPIGESFKKLVGVKVILENDAVMGGLGEARVGAGRRVSIVGFLTIGTGIGGCKFVDGEPDARAYGFEPGHMIISNDGKVKYFEEFASGTAMAKIYGKPAEAIEDSEAWDMETQLLAIGIHNVTVLWSPEMIILGGSLMKKVDIERIKKLAKQQMKNFPKIPEMVIGELGDKAGLVGALVRLGKN
jgi:predicted NBD/HSP70 family sugar kinase